MFGKPIDANSVVRLTKEIHDKLKTSHKIVSRIKQPFYFGQPDIPQVFTDFKQKVTSYRAYAHNEVATKPDLNLPKTPHEFKSFKKDTFASLFVTALTVSLFGIGECTECAMALINQLILQGHGNFAFVSIRFLNATYGQEQSHVFVVANLFQLPPSAQNITLQKFFNQLSNGSIIADPFLNLCFYPKDVHAKFDKYLNAYGGEAIVNQVMHLKNYHSGIICYQSWARMAHALFKNMKKTKIPILPIGYSEIISKSNVSKNAESVYRMENKQRLKDDTMLINLLREGTGLTFFGLRNNDYQVDAVCEMKGDCDRNKATELNAKLEFKGRMFNTENKKTVFVLEGINLSAEPKSLGSTIQNKMRL